MGSPSIASQSFGRFRTTLMALAVGAATFLGSVHSADAARRKAPVKTPPYSAIVIDAATGNILHADQHQARRHPASLTKLMTLHLLFEAIDAGRLHLDTPLKISDHAAAQPPTKLGLVAGNTIAVRDVILGLITKSANDAAVVAAEALAGSEEAFAGRMTRKAHALGMKQTVFRNASGLPDPAQVTTAQDLASLSRAIISQFPHHYHFFSTQNFTYGGVTHTSHNRFMNWFEGADGLKTGFIRASGFNLAASAMRDDRRIIGVVIGGTSPTARDNRMGQILEASFTGKEITRSPDTRYAVAPKSAPPTADIVPIAAPGQALRFDATPAVIRGSDKATRGGQWAVQVGALPDQKQARNAAAAAQRAAPQALKKAVFEASSIKSQRNTLVRARLVGITAEQARDACRALQKKRMACFVVAPSNATTRAAAIRL
jgi:D-alanyl-D-alanine carboxypeptidase